MNLVKVVCTHPASTVGRIRYVSTDTGFLYADEDGNSRVARGLRKQSDGSYVSPSFKYVPADTLPVAGQPYPDGNPKSAQGAKKFSLRYLPLSASVEVNRALEDGAKKYGPANWREKGVAASVYVDAALRHIGQYFDCKEDNASDSGVHNLGHAMACLAIIIDAEKAGTLTDDRPFPFPNGDALLKRS